jgi:UDP-glucuronate decarboxylase
MANPILLEDLEHIHSIIGKREDFVEASVVVTGCAGFLGFYFLQYLVRYAERIGVTKIIGLDSFLLGKPKWLIDLVTDYPLLLDIRAFDISEADIRQVEGATDASFVIHAASVASPSFYRKYPIETIDANVWGLRSLLEVYRGRKTLKGLLFFSSSEIYGDPDHQFIPTDEEYRGNVSCHGPRACYDESKRFGETLCWVYAKQFGMPITVARPFNNYGPGMRIGDKRLPADFAKCVLENKDIVILSDGTPTRTFCYVSDAIAGYFLCLLHGKYDYFNIGVGGPEIAVRDLARLYQFAGNEILGYSGQVHYEASGDPDYMTDNPNRRCPAIAKAETILGYRPSIPVGDGVYRYLRFLNHERLQP